MAKALFGHVGIGPDVRVLSEMRRLRDRVRELEGELARHNWFTTPEEPKLVFEDDRDKLWDEAMARRTREL